MVRRSALTVRALRRAGQVSRKPPLELRADRLRGAVLRVLACPECGRTFTATFDAGDFLAREVGRDRDALLREIHLLGLHYHWPESELMAMTPRRRKRYLNHLVEALGA